MKNTETYKISFTGIFIAISVTISFFNIMVPIYGIPGMRISVSSFASVIPALLFGPLYGGAAMGLTDALSYFLVRPEGGFNIFLTITAVLKGVLLGGMYAYLKKKKLPEYVRVLLCLIPANILVTTINTEIIMLMYSIKKAFLVFYIPRLIEEVINIVVQSSVVTVLLSIVKKQNR